MQLEQNKKKVAAKKKPKKEPVAKPKKQKSVAAKTEEKVNQKETKQEPNESKKKEESLQDGENPLDNLIAMAAAAGGKELAEAEQEKFMKLLRDVVANRPKDDKAGNLELTKFLEMLSTATLLNTTHKKEIEMLQKEMNK